MILVHQGILTNVVSLLQSFFVNNEVYCALGLRINHQLLQTGYTMTNEPSAERAGSRQAQLLH